MRHDRQAVVYCRVSTAMQERDGVSLEAQLDMARDYCRRKGWDLVGHYVDVMSGTVDKRPDLARLEKDVRARRFGAVICYKIDRISRNVGHFHEILDVLETAQVDLVSLTQDIDTSTASGRLLLNILISVAQNESEVISERVSMAMRYKAGQGACLITTPPYGYRYKPGSTDDEGRRVPASLVIEPDEAEVVRLIFDLYLKHRSIQAVCRQLNAEGYRSATGTTWQKGAVTRLLQNPLYRGDLVFGRGATERRGRKRKLVSQPRSRWIIHEGAVPMIVAPDVFDDAAALLAQNAGMAPRRSNAYHNRAWSSVLYCAGCGHPLWYHSLNGGTGDGRLWGAYGCYVGTHAGLASCSDRGRITDLMLENLVLPAIAEAFDRASLIEHSGASAPAARAPRKRVDRVKQIADIEEQRRRLNRAYFVTKRIGDEEHEAAMAELDKRQAALSEPETITTLPTLPHLPHSFDVTWRALPNDGERGRFIQTVVERIDVGKQTVSIQLRAFDHPDWPDEPLIVQKRRIRRWKKRGV